MAMSSDLFVRRLVFAAGAAFGPRPWNVKPMDSQLLYALTDHSQFGLKKTNLLYLYIQIYMYIYLYNSDIITNHVMATTPLRNFSAAPSFCDRVLQSSSYRIGANNNSMPS